MKYKCRVCGHIDTIKEDDLYLHCSECGSINVRIIREEEEIPKTNLDEIAFYLRDIACSLNKLLEIISTWRLG